MTEQTFLNRYDEIGPWRLIAYFDGHVLVRRKGAAPVLMHLGKWLKLSVKPVDIRKDGSSEGPF